MTPQDDVHEHDRGLIYDLPRLVSRRRSLALLGGAGLTALVGCSADTGGGSNGGSSHSGGSSGEEIPAETGGPFPADGSNGVNVLSESGVVRRDITTSFGSGSGVAEGVPLTIRLKILDVSNGGAPLQGAAVYVWHCDRAGGYSMYSASVVNENYLRGVQEADADGFLTFTSIYPGAYPGRWPHIHFEVYPSLGDATSASGKLRTSQIALPEEASRAVYASEGYEKSTAVLAQSSLASDNVFSDGYSLQLATVTGDVADGMTATLNVPV
jgi:protocatechuate 3,4-dioxygenase beta subunit